MKKNGRLVGATGTSKKHTEWCRLQQRNLSILDLLKKWPQCHTERAVGKYARAVFLKGKRNRAVCLEYQIVRGERVKVSKSRILTREEDQSESMERRLHSRVDSTVKEGRFQGGEGGQATRVSLVDVEGSMSE